VLGTTLAAHHNLHMPSKIAIASDNMPAVSWITKGLQYIQYSISLPLARLHYACNFTYIPVSTPGASNHIADCCYCLFHLLDVNFVHYMNYTYLVQPCWMLVTPPIAKYHHP